MNSKQIEQFKALMECSKLWWLMVLKEHPKIANSFDEWIKHEFRVFPRCFIVACEHPDNHDSSTNWRKYKYEFICHELSCVVDGGEKK